MKSANTDTERKIFFWPQNLRPAQISSDVCVAGRTDGRTDSSHFRVLYSDAVKTSLIVI